MSCVDGGIGFTALVVQRDRSTVQGEACRCIRCELLSFVIFFLIPFTSMEFVSAASNICICIFFG